MTWSSGQYAPQGIQKWCDLLSFTLISGPLVSGPRRGNLAKQRKPRKLCVS
ncbi:hypothetical protein DPMN_077426 [Dreissena polymorpha]|uniref:Uncharacterized protein n=1 Tax=Dreissena polymorpha TaxID=45954 RepID=A0A9D4BNA1_DREPO|nr:hypothetical protein DPMN_077426 [Dreissena polymorpha]